MHDSGKHLVVMVYDVNLSLIDKEVKEEIFERISSGSDITEEEFINKFSIKHKYKAKEGRRYDSKRNHVVAQGLAKKKRQSLHGMGKLPHQELCGSSQVQQVPAVRTSGQASC